MTRIADDLARSRATATSALPGSTPTTTLGPAAATMAQHETAHVAAPATAASDGYAVASPSAPTPQQQVAALAQKLGIDNLAGSDAQGVAPQAPDASLRKRIGKNLRAFFQGLRAREKRLVDKAVALFQAIGLAATRAATFADLKQLKEFAEMAFKEGAPGEILAVTLDVAGFVLKHPEDARAVLRFLDKAEKDTYAQQSPWMQGAAPTQAIGAPHDVVVQELDVAVIGGGIAGATAAKAFADAFAQGTSAPRRVGILEKDSEKKREHMASLRNAGVVCSALDYVFGADEAVGDKPVDRIAEALGIPRAEAEQVFASLVHVMHGATAQMKATLGEMGVDAELTPSGGFDIARTDEELAEFRAAAQMAQKNGLDWEAIDAKVLDATYGVKSPRVKGALRLNDTGQMHPGKLIKALFEHAQKTSKSVDVLYETEVLSSKRVGDRWLLQTNRGVISAKHVIDAREAFAPYRFREARFSQIHVLDVPKDSRPMQLGGTNAYHALSYMRKIDDGKFIVGSGDYPIDDPAKPPKPLASVALYAAAHFKKLYPDVPFTMENVWGGVFGCSPDEIPVAGELADGWYVVGGVGGSGLSLTPALTQQVVHELLGDGRAQQFTPRDVFSPRRFFDRELRADLARALSLKSGVDVDPASLKIEIGAGAPLKGERTTLFVDEKTLDAMNPDAQALMGEQGVEEVKRREAVKAKWLQEQVAQLV